MNFFRKTNKALRCIFRSFLTQIIIKVSIDVASLCIVTQECTWNLVQASLASLRDLGPLNVWFISQMKEKPTFACELFFSQGLQFSASLSLCLDQTTACTMNYHKKELLDLSKIWWIRSKCELCVTWDKLNLTCGSWGVCTQATKITIYFNICATLDIIQSNSQLNELF